MQRNVARLTGLIFGSCILAAQPAGTYPPQMDGARVEVYKTLDDVKLNLYIFQPAGHSATDKRAAIVFFFGGGWRSGNPQQFEPQCRYLASRGMVAVTADYRVSSRHGVKVPESVEDARSAIGWVRQNAPRLGIDPSRIAAGGGSAGGHIAAAAGVTPASGGSRPDALVLFNPVLVMAPVPDNEIADAESWRKFQVLLQKMPAVADVERVAISPYHHVEKGAPPTIIFHGKADATVPYATAELFTTKMIAVGNRCELVGFDGENHGFFNYGRSGNKAYEETLRRAAEFLTSLGYLPK